MVILQNISYTQPNKDLLFGNIHLTVNNREKTALIERTISLTHK